MTSIAQGRSQRQSLAVPLPPVEAPLEELRARAITARVSVSPAVAAALGALVFTGADTWRGRP